MESSLLFYKTIFEHLFCSSHFTTGAKGIGQHELNAKLIWRLDIWATKLKIFQCIFF